MTFKLYFTAANEELLRAIENLKLDEILLVDDTKCEEQLSVLRRLFTLLEMLVLVTRKNDKQTILTTTLKFFNVFLRNVLQRFPAEVVSIIKTVQRSTRQVQSLCAHAKATKDSATLAHVPRIKKQLEQLIYQIKDTLKKLGAEDAFWLGNLKNRYLNGDEIVDDEMPVMSHKRGRRKNEEENEKRIRVEPKVEMDEEAIEVNDDENESNESNESDSSTEEE